MPARARMLVSIRKPATVRTLVTSGFSWRGKDIRMPAKAGALWSSIKNSVVTNNSRCRHCRDASNGNSTNSEASNRRVTLASVAVSSALSSGRVAHLGRSQFSVGGLEVLAFFYTLRFRRPPVSGSSPLLLGCWRSFASDPACHASLSGPMPRSLHSVT